MVSDYRMLTLWVVGNGRGINLQPETSQASIVSELGQSQGALVLQQLTISELQGVTRWGGWATHHLLPQAKTAGIAVEGMNRSSLLICCSTPSPL